MHLNSLQPRQIKSDFITSDVYSSPSKPKIGAIKRNEYTQNIKTMSPLRHNSNPRLSFQSQSPTRFDEAATSSAKSSKVIAETSPFCNDSPAVAHSEDNCQPSERLADKIQKQFSSDMKAIKISKLIDFHRELEQRHSVLTDTKMDTEMKVSEKADLKVSEFNIKKVEVDRFIPLRQINESEELSCIYDTKIEITNSPPLNLFEDSSIESQPQNNT